MMKLHSVVFLFSLYFVFADCQSPLRNACKINQFRCSDGSKCLNTEKLCNARKDCPEGEDEKGNAQWDCTKILLSQPCDAQKEFRCRFGGCVPRDKICDGVPDCWGATDESTDTCSGRRQPTKATSTTSRPRPTTPRPPPATPKAIVNGVTNNRPSRPQPPETSSKAPSRPSVSASSDTGRGCPPIDENPLMGFAIHCETEYGKPLGACSTRVEPGGTATYRCAKYYRLASLGSSSTVRTCQSNGQWTPRRSSFHCAPVCGEAGGDITGLVTGGVSSKRGKWPWHAALYHEDPPNSGRWDLKCGGSLITGQAILTAAHCVTLKHAERPISVKDIRVAMGKFHRNFNKKDAGEQVRGVRLISVHPDYNHNTLESDIAIIFLDSPATISDYVRPVCLPDEEKLGDIHPGVEGNLVGWGRTTGGRFKEDLQEAKIPVVDSHTCKAAHQTFATLVRSTNFCAGYRNGTSACDGDSGGGLVFLDSDTKRHFNVHGIVSAGVAKSTGGGGCEDKYYAVFTRVAKFHRWIEMQLDANFQR